MAVSKQNLLSSTRKEVRSTPSKLLFSVFSSPRVDLSSSVSAYLTPPTPPPSNSFLPFHPPALPFVSQPSNLLLQLRVIASAQTDGLGPLFSCLSIFTLPNLFPTDSWGWDHSSSKGVWRRNVRLVSPACVLV
ncbi:hypothetical protein mRhiFer1_009862 [Rhinolophus ferrumequinum]|uniref:Uncharacterized protein n=1 Tax=Rhinolophus ferrumequinum TaxID=59479 RepID=A0A7J7YSF2_RHIFE|nr:hypothetical protein mRhiFer1_009862 [Rhinolophus ferrumequinum]